MTGASPPGWARWTTAGPHLVADTDAELHAFAARLGMRREWFQHKEPAGRTRPTTTCPIGPGSRALELGADPGHLAPGGQDDAPRVRSRAEVHGSEGHGSGGMTGEPAHRAPSGGSLDPRTPVLVGVGAASADAEAAETMVLALEAAGADAGRPGLLARIDRIAVPQGSWAYPDPGRLVADRWAPPGPGPTWWSWASPNRA